MKVFCFYATALVAAASGGAALLAVTCALLGGTPAPLWVLLQTVVVCPLMYHIGTRYGES